MARLDDVQGTLGAWMQRGDTSPDPQPTLSGCPREPDYRIVKYKRHVVLEKQVEPDLWVEVERSDEPAYYRVSMGTLYWLCSLRQEKVDFT